MSTVYDLARLENLRLLKMQHAAFQDFGLTRRHNLSPKTSQSRLQDPGRIKMQQVAVYLIQAEGPVLRGRVMMSRSVRS